MTWTARIARIGPAFGGVIDVGLDITNGKDTFQQHILAESDATDEDIRRMVRDTLRALAPSLDGAASHDHLIGTEETA